MSFAAASRLSPPVFPSEPADFLGPSRDMKVDPLEDVVEVVRDTTRQRPQ